MKRSVRLIQGIALVHLASMLPAAAAATISLGTATPTEGDGVKNLNFSTNDATNTVIAWVPSDYVGNGNPSGIGQTFKTGNNTGGYSLSAISVRQVSWSTDWDFTGGTITLQIFRIDTVGNGVSNITALQTETVTVGGEDDGLAYASGTPNNAQWLTVNLGSPLSLAAGMQYGFQIKSSGTTANDGFFMQLDGTSTDSYSDGFAIGTALVSGELDSSLIWDGGNGKLSDRAFVATMTAVPEPSAALLGGLGMLMLLRRRR